MSEAHQQADSEQPGAQTRRRRWAWIAAIAGTVLGVTLIAARAWADDIIERRLRPATIELLEARFDSDVELADLDVRVFPTLAIRGEGLVLRKRGRTDIPPVITIRTFTIESSVRELWTRHIDRVRLEGLHIAIPPRRGKDMPTLTRRQDERRDAKDVTIHELVSEDGLLTIASKRPDKAAREFRLARLRFEDLQFWKPTPFEAELSNPVPEGVIHTVGTFGPWDGEEPSLTPIAGSYRFDADLGTIKGIGGALHAEGSFNGPLERIDTTGDTKTERFHLSTGGTKFPLLVKYKAVVDGTSGDTFLESVEADLGRSHISANGGIVKVEGVKGRRITLDTKVRKGRLEDFIKLTTRVKRSPIAGDVDVTATLDIPPGPADVVDRMDLAGVFQLAAARFTSPAIQERIDQLSRSGLGRPKDEGVDEVASNMKGEFKMSGGRLTLRSLTFKVEGAVVQLAGYYDVRSEVLDFTGALRLDAPISKTQTGWKSVVLRVFDPLFRRDGAGTVLPITVSGTREHPKFGVDVKKALLRK